MSGFLHGYGSVLQMFPKEAPHSLEPPQNRYYPPGLADYYALRGDWYQVGHDLGYAMGQHPQMGLHRG